MTAKTNRATQVQIAASVMCLTNTSHAAKSPRAAWPEPPPPLLPLLPWQPGMTIRTRKRPHRNRNVNWLISRLFPSSRPPLTRRYRPSRTIMNIKSSFPGALQLSQAQRKLTWATRTHAPPPNKPANRSALAMMACGSSRKTRMKASVTARMATR